MPPIIGSGLTAPLLKMFGVDARVRTEPAQPLARGDDMVSLSPESLAMQETIAENQAAAQSSLTDDDQLDGAALAFLAAVAQGTTVNLIAG